MLEASRDPYKTTRMIECMENIKKYNVQCFLATPPQKKSIFVRNFKIEINTQEDSPSSDLSEMIWFFYPKPHFWCKILMTSIISYLKNRLFFKKTKNLFHFFSIYDFLILWSRILCPSSFNIFKFFFYWKEHVKMQGTTVSLFSIELYFSYVYRHLSNQTPIVGMVFESLNL